MSAHDNSQTGILGADMGVIGSVLDRLDRSEPIEADEMGSALQALVNLQHGLGLIVAERDGYRTALEAIADEGPAWDAAYLRTPPSAGAIVTARAIARAALAEPAA